MAWLARRSAAFMPLQLPHWTVAQINSMPPAISLVKRHKCRAPAAASTAWLRLSAAGEGPPAVRRLWSATGPRSQRVEGKERVEKSGRPPAGPSRIDALEMARKTAMAWLPRSGRSSTAWFRPSAAGEGPPAPGQ